MTPRSAAAFMSMELLHAPVVISGFMSGRPSITSRLKGVRSAHHVDDGETLQRLDDGGVVAEPAVEDLDLDLFGDARPVGEFEGDVLIVVEDRCLTIAYAPYYSRARNLAGGANLEPVVRKDRGVSA